VDTRERCVVCSRDFTVFREKGKPYATSIPARSIGDGLWVCEEHHLNQESIEKLKERFRRR
jgi:hypothetical protein